MVNSVATAVATGAWSCNSNIISHDDGGVTRRCLVSPNTAVCCTETNCFGLIYHQSPA